MWISETSKNILRSQILVRYSVIYIFALDNVDIVDTVDIVNNVEIIDTVNIVEIVEIVEIVDIVDIALYSIPFMDSEVMTNSQIRDTLLCQSRAQLKVVKWCQKR